MQYQFTTRSTVGCKSFYARTMQWSLVSVCAAAAVAAINTASAVAVAHSPATFSFLGTDAIIGEEGMVVVKAQKDNVRVNFTRRYQPICNFTATLARDARETVLI